MNSNITKQFGIIIAALATIGAELLGGTPTADASGGTDAGSAEPKRRGRPPGSGAGASAPAGDASAPTGGKTYEELREMIKPLVEAGQGDDVKKTIAKYAKDLKELATFPDKHAAFAKDLDALAF